MPDVRAELVGFPLNCVETEPSCGVVHAMHSSHPFRAVMNLVSRTTHPTFTSNPAPRVARVQQGQLRGDGAIMWDMQGA